MADGDGILRIALVQLKVGSQKEKNVSRAVELIEECVKERSVDLICLPECFNSPYGTKFFREYAEPVPGGETCAVMAATAKRFNIWLVAGSIPEKGNDGQVYNTSVTFNPNGDVVGFYRKIHLFDIDIPGKMTFKESDTLSPGSDFFSFSCTNKAQDEFTVGIGICYDIRFPELALVYARQHRVDVLLYPGAFNTTTGPLHWELLARARAVDTQCYVGVCSPAQDVTASYVAHAESLVVSPWGAVLDNAGKNEKYIVAEVSRAELDRVRTSIPTQHQLRKDMYTFSAKV